MQLIESAEEGQPSFRLRPVKDLENYIFYVQSYQRGYKWTSQEAIDLLNDISEFNADQGIYCLQPLVVKKLGPDDYDLTKPFAKIKEVFELIDGQQRMTTIYMIMSLLNDAPSFCQIAYKTREGSEKFLDNIMSLPIYELDEESLSDIPKLIGEINLLWADYISKNRGNDNVDNYHFFQVYQTLRLWFKDKHVDEIANFKSNLLNFTNVIWYQIETDETPEKVFLKINSGKILLTNAELIKALFLISNKDNSGKELNDFRQNAIAQEWNDIENALQNPEFWYFINDDSKAENSPTRIDLLFNILKKKDTRKLNKGDDFFTYRQYAKDFKEGKKLNWQEVKELFDQLQEWYEDREVYHRMGFILSQKFRTIQQLVTLSKGHRKSYFKKELRDIIRDRFKNNDKNEPSVYNLSMLDYEESYGPTRAVLQLFNIETYQKSDSNFRFPFHRFKRENWSIEHIHAQQSKLFTTGEEVEIWANDSIRLLQDLNLENIDAQERNLLLQSKLKSMIAETGNGNLTALNKLRLKELSDELSEYLSIHKIGNLALLDIKTNSAIGNKRFLEKRLDILEIDKRGGVIIDGKFSSAFIPVCTKNAFLKYYTKGIENIQQEYWSAKDRSDYENSIAEILAYYYSS